MDIFGKSQRKLLSCSVDCGKRAVVWTKTAVNSQPDFNVQKMWVTFVLK